MTLDELTLRQLLRDGWSPSATERSEFLRKALQEDEVPVVKALLEIGADPNGLYYGTGTTPLMMVRSAATARALLDAGGNLFAQTEGGVTALLQAAHLAPEVSEALLKVGVPADQPDSYGRTPLWQAACVGNAGVVKLLLRRGADPTRHPAGASAVECARESQPYERLYPQRLIDSDPAFSKDFDAVIALLDQALAKRHRK